MSELAVSVIIPAFNAAATIERVLEALVAQDVAEPYEVIVVDNGSTDGTAELAERGPGSPTVIRRGPASPSIWYWSSSVDSRLCRPCPASGSAAISASAVR